jgi:hypothetical protein
MHGHRRITEVLVRLDEEGGAVVDGRASAAGDDVRERRLAGAFRPDDGDEAIIEGNRAGELSGPSAGEVSRDRGREASLAAYATRSPTSSGCRTQLRS